MLSNSDLVESILEVDVSEDRLVENTINVEPNIRKWVMAGDDKFIDASGIFTKTNIWGSCLGCESYVGSNWEC